MKRHKDEDITDEFPRRHSSHDMFTLLVGVAIVLVIIAVFLLKK
jgi:hypothetical protein